MMHFHDVIQLGGFVKLHNTMLFTTAVLLFLLTRFDQSFAQNIEIRSSSDEMTLVEGATLELSCVIMEPVCDTIKWYKDSLQLSENEAKTSPEGFPEYGIYLHSTRGDGLQQFTLEVRNVMKEQYGVYKCKCFVSAQRKPVVKDDIVVEILYEPDPLFPLCSLEPSQLICSSEKGKPLRGLTWKRLLATDSRNETLPSQNDVADNFHHNETVQVNSVPAPESVEDELLCMFVDETSHSCSVTYREIYDNTPAPDISPSMTIEAGGNATVTCTSTDNLTNRSLTPNFTVYPPGSDVELVTRSTEGSITFSNVPAQAQKINVWCNLIWGALNSHRSKETVVTVNKVDLATLQSSTVHEENMTSTELSPVASNSSVTSGRYSFWPTVEPRATHEALKWPTTALTAHSSTTDTLQDSTITLTTELSPIDFETPSIPDFTTSLDEVPMDLTTVPINELKSSTTDNDVLTKIITDNRETPVRTGITRTARTTTSNDLEEQTTTLLKHATAIGMDELLTTMNIEGTGTASAISSTIRDEQTDMNDVPVADEVPTEGSTTFRSPSVGITEQGELTEKIATITEMPTEVLPEDVLTTMNSTGVEPSQVGSTIGTTVRTSSKEGTSKPQTAVTKVTKGMKPAQTSHTTPKMKTDSDAVIKDGNTEKPLVGNKTPNRDERGSFNYLIIALICSTITAVLLISSTLIFRSRCFKQGSYAVSTVSDQPAIKLAEISV